MTDFSHLTPLERPDPGMVLCPECQGRRYCTACEGTGELSPGRTCIMCIKTGLCPICNAMGQLRPDQLPRDRRSDLL
jgi:hypothetical protein